MAWQDWLVIALYFIVIGVIAWRSGRNQKSTADYFLAGRNVGWFAIGASIFTANIGSEHIVGLAGAGANSGMGMAHFEMHAWVLIMLAYVFVPFYYKAGVYTIPEFLEKRFGAKTRWFLSVVSLVAYVFTKVSVTVYAGAIVFQAFLGDTFGSPDNAFWVGAFTTVILTGIYTVFGGMRAILYTATPQAILLILGSGFITYYGLTTLAEIKNLDPNIFQGWGALVDVARENSSSFALWRPLSDGNFPWLGIMIASPIIGIWYWCTDQYIVQRTFSAKDLETARKGALFGGILKISPILIFLIPGMIGWALNKADGARFFLEIDSQTQAIKGDSVFPMLVCSLLPVGFRGLIVACLLAALMSSLASLFNSSASLFTVDIYEKLVPGKSQAHYVNVGRIATTVVVGLGMVWIPVMKLISTGGLYDYLQSVQSYLAPSITAVFLLGIFWRRMNGQAALAGLVAGFILGMSKLTIQTFFGASAGKINAPALAAIGDFNAYYSAGVLFAATVLVIVFVALITEKPKAAQTEGLTYAWLMSDAKQKAEVQASWTLTNKLFTGIILAGVIGMYIYFSFWLS
ncbi:MAG: sodium:solute symporter [Opitutales bacterium]|nr:sodium:solute symporter [Opitutales bacterium]